MISSPTSAPLSHQTCSTEATLSLQEAKHTKTNNPSFKLLDRFVTQFRALAYQPNRQWDTNRYLVLGDWRTSPFTRSNTSPFKQDQTGHRSKVSLKSSFFEDFHKHKICLACFDDFCSSKAENIGPARLWGSRKGGISATNCSDDHLSVSNLYK